MSLENSSYLSRDFINIGKIVGPHGIKGNIKLFIASDFIEFIAHNLIEKSTRIKLFSHKNEFDFSLVSFRNNDFIVSEKSVKTRTDAENLGKMKIFCKRSDLPALNEDEYYLSDLIGKQVQGDSMEHVGKVINILNFGAGDIIEIEEVSGGKILIPFEKRYFISSKDDVITLKTPQLI
ncbi:MAG: ribosome maturation factor RimM [Rickettsiaceae bacterium]|nr:ribosome maturation factor RimM [Rickettsiaceae bacterium]